MKEILLEYAKAGAMTKEDLAKVLKVSPDVVRRMAKTGKIPRIPGIRFIRFDPMRLIEVLCETPSAKKPGSVTIERRNPSGNQPSGGFRKTAALSHKKRCRGI